MFKQFNKYSVVILDTYKRAWHLEKALARKANEKTGISSVWMEQVRRFKFGVATWILLGL